MVSLSGGVIEGNSAYYYDPSQEYYRGVFVEGRTVTLGPFHMAKYEMTYELWYEVWWWAIGDVEWGGNGYKFVYGGREGVAGTDGAEPTEAAKTEPVTNISWRDAVIWCNAYSEMSGKDPVYRDTSGGILRDATASVETLVDITKWAGKNGYRLPTEAEWEYAARGGTPDPTGPFAYKWAGTDTGSDLKDYAWCSVNSSGITHPVGGKKINDAQLYDMSGNVREWCWDQSGNVDAATPWTGPVSGGSRVIRGGSWYDYTSHCAVATRYYVPPYNVYNFLGFRVVCGN
jgi:formylglycine-generating enzyme required for sulfatase activity